MLEGLLLASLGDLRGVRVVTLMEDAIFPALLWGCVHFISMLKIVYPLAEVGYQNKPIIQNGDFTLVWITTPRVLLPCFILPILMKISKGTDTEASDKCNVCLSCFNSFLRALGV